MMKNPKVTNMRLKSVSTQQEVERSPIGSELQRYNETALFWTSSIFPMDILRRTTIFSKAPQVKKVANYMETIQICDPASDKNNHSRAFSFNKKVYQSAQGDKGMI